MVIYISGGMTDVKGYKKNFKVAEVKLKQKYPEAIVINPAEIVGPPGMTWADYMSIDLIMLKRCTHIYRLSNWNESKGAQIESQYARKLGIISMYEWEV